MEPGWSPLRDDPRPYFQVDLLEPTWVSGVVTQGSEATTGYFTKYRLAFALAESDFTDYTESANRSSPVKVRRGAARRAMMTSQGTYIPADEGCASNTEYLWTS